MHYCICLILCISMSHAATFTIPSSELKTISEAMTKAQRNDTIVVKPGVYKEKIIVATSITLISEKPLAAEINGRGRGKVVTLTNESKIIGFDITNGTIGIYSSGESNFIHRCRIRNQNQTGIMVVGQLPLIEDNFIVFNKGSGIHGWDIQSNKFSINHNTIAYNDNNGISIGGSSNVTIENNIIAFNGKVGTKIDEKAKISSIKNCFYENSEIVPLLPASNIADNPEFTNFRKLDFSLSDNSPCKNVASDNTDLGVRIDD